MFVHCQIQQREERLRELQDQMRMDQQCHSELSRQLAAAKRTMVKLQDEADERDREAGTRVRQLEATITWLREDVGSAERRTRELVDDAEEKDAQLKITTMSLEMMESQNQQLMNQVNTD